MNEIKELIIKRSKWLTPEKSLGAGSYLLNEMGLMCCLGFAAIKLGLTEDEIVGYTYIASTDVDNLDNFSQFCQRNSLVANGIGNTKLSSEVAIINDDNQINNEEREKQLIKLFGENNIILSFID